ncbi:hypothetical protein [Phenylobacterium sp.]|jgi:hypothetical protein|uniref:hypothetical protein n=1 Tax=Phenylobacterium sp. TaxID=1871053 RepID=UPI002F955035
MDQDRQQQDQTPGTHTGGAPDGRSGGRTGQNHDELGDTRRTDETGAHKGGANGTGGPGGTGGSVL